MAFGRRGGGDLAGLARRSTVVPEPARRSAAAARAGRWRARTCRTWPGGAGRRVPGHAARLRRARALRWRPGRGHRDGPLSVRRAARDSASTTRTTPSFSCSAVFQRRRRPPALRLYSRLQWRRLERFERRLVAGQSAHPGGFAARRQSAVRARGRGRERARHSERHRRRGVSVSWRRRPEQAANLLFLGKLDFRPNAESARVVCRRRCCGRCSTRVPTARLFAVGANPPRWLVEAGQHDDRIAVTGYVADERPYLARCAALVLPLRTGGGTRLKALIAMASGLPIVSTRLGMEGLDAEPGEDYLVAESRRGLGDRVAAAAGRSGVARSAWRTTAEHSSSGATTGRACAPRSAPRTRGSAREPPDGRARAAAGWLAGLGVAGRSCCRERAEPAARSTR